jgi:hypothetical protein
LNTLFRKSEPMLAYTLTLTLTCLFAVAAIATGLSLLDSWLRGSSAYRVLKREQALLDAGFVPQVGAYEVRLRKEARKPARRTLAAATRPNARRLPLPATQIAG